MKSDRRNFLKAIASSSALMSVSPLMVWSHPETKLNILVLGGTNFLGPAIVQAGLQRGHNITLFNRGVTNPSMFPQLPLIRGDRESGIIGYAQLQNHKWDAVIDVWPEKSQLVDEATNALQGNTEHYVFISSIAVYQDFNEVGLHEASKLLQPSDEKEEWGYSEQKVTAENLVLKRFPQNHTLLRPGPIKGWRDPALDLVYWLDKLNRNQSILAPGSGKDPLQFIDVKDVGRFAIHAIENQLVGVYNCTGPKKEPLLWDEFLTQAKDHLASTSKIHWASEAFLKANQVRSFEDLPLWAPLSEDRGFMQISNKKSVSSGFKFTSLENTIDDCLQWYSKQMDLKIATENTSVGLNRSKELQLIDLL